MTLIGIRRSSRRPIAHLARRATSSRPLPSSQDPTQEEVYEMLCEAAHLVSRASRKLRNARQNQAGFALQDVVGEIHEQIRQLPALNPEQTPVTRHCRNDHCDFNGRD